MNLRRTPTKRERALNRREFLVRTAGTAAGAAALTSIGPLSSPALADSSGLTVPAGKRGIILYTVRDVISRRPDPANGIGGGFAYTLQQLSGMGYKQVEFAGYGQDTSILGRQITPAEIRKLLDDNGLIANGSHIGIDQVVNPDAWKRQLDTAATLGMAYLGTPSIPTSSPYKADWARVADQFNQAGQYSLTNYGISLYQHNHHGEYAFLLDAGPLDANGHPTRSTGLRGLQYFFTVTDPKYVWFEMDIYWAYVAQYRYQTYTDANGNKQTNIFDPIATVAANPHQFPLFHVKDGVRDNNSADGYDMVPAGTGVVPLQKLLNAIGDSGYHHPNYEQDNAPGDSAHPNQSLQFSQISYNNISSWRG